MSLFRGDKNSTRLARQHKLLPIATQQINFLDDLVVVSVSGRLHVLLIEHEKVSDRAVEATNLFTSHSIFGTSGEWMESRFDNKTVFSLRRDLPKLAETGWCAEKNMWESRALKAIANKVRKSELPSHNKYRHIASDIPSSEDLEEILQKSACPHWILEVFNHLNPVAARALHSEFVELSLGDVSAPNIFSNADGEMSILNARAACIAPLGYDLASLLCDSLELGGPAALEHSVKTVFDANNDLRDFLTLDVLDGLICLRAVVTLNRQSKEKYPSKLPTKIFEWGITCRVECRAALYRELHGS